MDYAEAVKYLYGHLPMYQRQGPAAYKNSLGNIVALDEMFAHPHKKFATVHVAGTNGKGSVAHMLASVFQTAGFKTGLYTSPHLKDYRERIKINGQCISKQFVCDFLDRFFEKNKVSKLEPSFFELSVALAFDYFKHEQIDIAIVEVGLGGRLDSTNIISPQLSVITNIGLDHTALLGDTLPLIAAEKAGIIKENIPVLIGQSHPQTDKVFINIANQKNATLNFADVDYRIEKSDQDFYSVRKNNELLFNNIKPDLKGHYQQKNILTTVAAIEILRKQYPAIKNEHIFSGLSNIVKNTGLLGRWQTVSEHPRVICDTAHNPDGLNDVVAQLKASTCGKLHIVIGLVSDKDIDGILDLLPQNAQYYFTRANVDRALHEDELAKRASKYNLKGNSYPGVIDAVKAAKQHARENDLIFVGGSTFVVAEIV